MLHRLKNAIRDFFNKKEEKPVWFHQMRMNKREQCPPEQYHCAVVWENGEVMEKCRYAKMTLKDPEMCVYSKMDITIGVKCVPSNALDFILRDN